MIIDNEIQSTKKMIISSLKDLINFKNLEPGEKLPSERMLSEKFNVSRGNLRDAIQTLEYYGLVKSIPLLWSKDEAYLRDGNYKSLRRYNF